MLNLALSPQLDTCDRSTLLDYFEHSWALEEMLMKSVVEEATFYESPDPLRNPIIFYLGHSPAFYINKLVQVGLLEQRINPTYERLFEMGVDPGSSEELDSAMGGTQWPAVEFVWEYRAKAKAEITRLIHQTPLELPINQNHPLWALMMGMDHNRVHFETSSMLIRQFSPEQLQRPQTWQYATSGNQTPNNTWVEVAGDRVALGKPQDSTTYGWDMEYGDRTVSVQPFLASAHLITNGEFLPFVEAGGYDNQALWDAESWAWKTAAQCQHPKFWVPHTEPHHGAPNDAHKGSQGGGYQYRALFDQIDLPLDWPVEVNHHEAMAYCRWRGHDIRLMTEGEWTLAVTQNSEEANYNLNLKFGSPTPVGTVENGSNATGLYDLRGNVWEWLGDNFTLLPGFRAHPLYLDHATPFANPDHKMMLGGSWASNGAMEGSSYRNWFRPHFYQHAGFRIAQSL